MNEFGELNKIILSILLIIKTNAIKFDVINQINNIYVNSFSENIKDFLNFPEKKYEMENSTNLKTIEKWVKNSNFQIESWQENIIENTIKLNENSVKIIELEIKLNNYSELKEEKSKIEKKINEKIKYLHDENYTLKEEKKSLELQNNQILIDLNKINLENKKNIEENKEVNMKLKEIKLNNEIIIQEKKSIEKQLIYSDFNYKALEERIKIIIKEKKNYENILTIVGKNHPSKNIKKIINDVLNIYDSISLLERDRLKIIQNINDIEYNLSISDKSEYSFKLNLEKNENFKILDEYKNKINEKKNKIHQLETEIKLSEFSQLKYSENKAGYESKINNLIEELQNTNIEISKSQNKDNNIRSNSKTLDHIEEYQNNTSNGKNEIIYKSLVEEVGKISDDEYSYKNYYNPKKFNEENKIINYYHKIKENKIKFNFKSMEYKNIEKN